ncbi:MAG: hypothetical protein ABW007_00860 [Chitinophagaceae bacterium]
MNPNEFQQLVERSVLQYPLSEGQTEERIIELADLVHFVDCFRPSLKINDDQPVGFSIVEEQGHRIGVIMQNESDCRGPQTFASHNDLTTLKRMEGLESIWLVIVNSSVHGNINKTGQLSVNLPDTGFDHVFSFHFFSHQVNQFK